MLLSALFASFALPMVALGAAAAAAAVPILIHLLSRQRYQVVPWAAIRFLMTAQKRHRRTIDRWLLLALRVLVLLLPLLAMCAATPWAERVWQSIRPGKLDAVSNLPRTHHILVLDSSLSMGAARGGQTRFEQALAQVQEQVRSANPGDAFTLIVLAGGAQAIVPGPANDASKVLAELQSLKLAHGTTDYTAGLALIADAVGRSPRNYPRKQVTFFTDAQRSAWSAILPRGETPAPDTWQRILPRADVVVVDVANEDVNNLAVVDVALADPLALVDAPTAITATVHNFGKGDRANVRLELLIGRPSASGTDTALVPLEVKTMESIPSGQRVSVTFPLEGPSRFRDAGLHLIQVRLSDADALPLDDFRTLAVEVRESLPVLIVNGKPSPDPLKRGSAYVQEALDPMGKRWPGNPARPRVVSLAEFADPVLTELAGIDCVFLCDVPTLNDSQLARLEAHLKRGGGLVVNLGPNAAANLDWYNRAMVNGGNGFLPGKLLGVQRSAKAGDADFRLVAEEIAFRRPPLAIFASDNSRAGLGDVPFQSYVRFDAPKGGRADRILSFSTPATARDPATPPDPAVVEYQRHRGRVILIASTLNPDWNEWAILPSFLPFIHETLRYAATSPDRHTLRVGESLEDLVPVTAIGLTASITDPDAQTQTVPVIAGDETGVIRLSDVSRVGLYRVALGGRKASVFAANAPESIPGGGSESDLTRVDPLRWKDLGAIQLVTDLSDIRVETADGAPVILTPRPHGPTLARWLLTLALLLLLVELWFAFRIGPSRAAAAGFGLAPAPTVGRTRLSSLFWWGLGLVPLMAATALIGSAIHADQTGQLLGFLPDSTRHTLEKALGVPAAGPGEGTRWRLESFSIYVASGKLDRRIVSGLMTFSCVLVLGLYWFERRGAGKWSRVLLPGLLRLAVVLLMGFVLLPQLRVAFDREGWPDVAILLDTSASMATVDEWQDPRVRAKAQELARTTDLNGVDRLRLAQAILTQKDGDWLDRLLTEREVKVHIYSLADQARLVAELDEPNDSSAGREGIQKLKADGESSRLGDGVQAVLKAFRGGSLAALIVFTDGITTAGDDLPRAGREAARAGVPLYLVGLGDAADPPDLIVSDLKCDDEVLKGDKLELQVRVSARGATPPASVPVILYERQGEKLLERARQTVTPDATGKAVRLQYTPTEVGEKSFVIAVPPLPNEAETGNNRLEKSVLVTETKRIKVLYLDGYPRYEYRFVKALLERETEAVRGNKSIELSTMLLDASPGFADLDKSALTAFPTKNQLFEYDVVILGDVQAAQLPRANQLFSDLGEFVKTRGGGLIVMAGEHGNPHKLFDSPLGELLPIVPTEASLKAGGTPPTSESSPITEGYKLKLTALGRSHPLLRFSAEEADNQRIWENLSPFFWYASGYRKKAAAEVLAVHPDRPAEGEPSANHPLVLQQFVGAGRVVFFGFDETWRWRFRTSEERFNQFWTQGVRTVARSKVVRIELRTDKQTAYRRDEPIRLTVRFPDDAPAPLADVPVRVQVARKPLTGPGSKSNAEAETTTVQLAKVEGTRATYQTLLTRTPEGEYTFTLTNPTPVGRDGRTPTNPPRTEAKVIPPPGERDRLEMNRSDLTKAAAESRGKFYTLAEADKLIEELPEVTRYPLNQPCPPFSVWNHAVVFGLIVLLLACEWWIRRRERLV